MTVTIRPGPVRGAAAAPPSKSMAHRLLLCAGLADGESVVRGVAPSEDVLATIDCLRALGADVRLDGDVAAVRGVQPQDAPAATLPCRECGSTLRFFVPLCLMSGRPMTLTGSPTLLSRPLSVYEDLCRARGWTFVRSADALRVAGRLTPGDYEIPGSVSSQFVSGLLFALPLLAGESTLTLRPPVESGPYIDMTLAALAAFGVRVERTAPCRFRIPGGQRPAARSVAVEGDWSNAAFLLALGVPVTGLSPDSLQGDRVCADCFRALDADAATLDLTDCPDLGPVLFAYAAARHGGRFTGTRRLRAKECDRGAAMREELAKFDVAVEIGENEITVGRGLAAPRETLDGHGDHRIVMALSVLSAQTGGTIRGAEAVNKSFPDFFSRLESLGIKVENYDGMDQ